LNYLLTLPAPSAEVKKSIDAAMKYLESVRVEGKKFETKSGESRIVNAPNNAMWYRFYEIGTNLPIFAGRDGVMHHELMEIEAERRNGYTWAGTWPKALLDVYHTTGYYENRIYVQVAGTQSNGAKGQTLTSGGLQKVEAK
jgi:PelA/Pel-15E family pectate lyase